MSRKAKKQFPGTSSYIDRHGKRRWRYRKNGRAVELGTNYGSDEFRRRYENAAYNAQRPNPLHRYSRHSFYSLSEKLYQTVEFQQLAASSQVKYRRIIKNFL